MTVLVSNKKKMFATVIPSFINIDVICWHICLQTTGSFMDNAQFLVMLSHWNRVKHIIIIVSDNGLSPARRRSIIWTNAGILLIGLLGIHFKEILVETIFSFKKMHLKMASAKWRLFRLGLNVLTHCEFYFGWFIAVITWVAWLSLWWFLECMKDHASMRTMHGNLKKVPRFSHLHISQ